MVEGEHHEPNHGHREAEAVTRSNALVPNSFLLLLVRHLLLEAMHLFLLASCCY